MWFKNLKLFRLHPDFKITVDALEEKLQTHAFQSSNPGQGVNLGWVPVLENSGFVYPLDQFFFITLQAEKKLLPASVVNQFTKAKVLEVEEQQGYKPGRKQVKEIKEQVTDTLLPKAFSIFRQTRVCLDMKNHWLWIDAGTPAKSDEVIALLAKTLDSMPIQSFMTEQSPSSCMTEWLFSDTAPAGFTLEPNAEFKSTQQDHATVRFTNVSPEQEDVIKHVESGKICTKLGLTWQDRITFMLNESLEIKKLAPLEILDEQRNPLDASDEERFDADMTLMCLQVNEMLLDLIDALGGEKHAD